MPTAVAYYVACRRQPTMDRTWGDVLDERIQDLEDCSDAELASIRIDLQLTMNAVDIVEAQHTRDEATSSTGATYGDEDNGDDEDGGDEDGGDGDRDDKDHFSEG
jgi:hypothetical protein